jgi:hypothetical protein
MAAQQRGPTNDTEGTDESATRPYQRRGALGQRALPTTNDRLF